MSWLDIETQENRVSVLGEKESWFCLNIESKKNLVLSPNWDSEENILGRVSSLRLSEIKFWSQNQKSCLTNTLQ